MKIRQAWLEQGNVGGGAKWKGWGLRRGERERVHWSEMGQQGRVRKEDKKRVEWGNEKELYGGGHGIELQSAWREECDLFFSCLIDSRVLIDLHVSTVLVCVDKKVC